LLLNWIQEAIYRQYIEVIVIPGVSHMLKAARWPDQAVLPAHHTSKKETAPKTLGIKPQCLQAALHPLRNGSKIVSTGSLKINHAEAWFFCA
jgi:hypothetical protein